jgi:hypothetical protein
VSTEPPEVSVSSTTEPSVADGSPATIPHQPVPAQPAGPSAFPPEPVPGRLAGPPRWRLAWLVAAVGAGWVVSALAILAHAGLILLPLAVLCVASLLRVGRGLVDRLMVATFLTAAGLIVGGLVFSLWPWGLDPVPVAGVMFTVIAVVAWLTGRRPRLPLRFSGSDLVLAAVGLGALVLELRPVGWVSGLGRFAMDAPSEDRVAHFAFFDAIHRLGGYPMLDQTAAKTWIQSPAQASYPTGSHLLYTIVDIFLRSTTDPGPSVAAFSRYFYLVLAGYAFMLVAVMWAARWLITPLVTGWRVVAVTAVIGAILVGGPYFALVTAGFDSEVVGLTFLVLTVAVAVRPPARLPERLLLLGAGVVLIAYVYYLFLPIAALAAVASILVHRDLRRSWRVVAAVAVAVGVISAIPLVFLLTSSLSLHSQALAAGASLAMPRSSVTAATVASLALLLTVTGRRFGRLRVMGLLLPVLLAVVVVFGVYQTASLGKTGYYFDKLMTAYFFVALAGSSTIVLALGGRSVAPAGSAGRSRTTRGRRLQDTGLGLAAVLLAFSGIAGFGLGPLTTSMLPGDWTSRPFTLGLWYNHNGKVRDPVAVQVHDQLEPAARQGLIADGRPTLFLTTNDAYVNWRLTFLNAVLNHTSGAHKDTVNDLLKTPVGGSPVDDATLSDAIATLRHAVAQSPDPLRIVVRDPATAAAVSSALADESDRVSVVQLQGS